MVQNNFKHLTKIYTLGLLLSSGCVLREPVFKESSNVDHNADGSCSTNTVRCCVGNHEEFSILGVAWNTASYGTLGAPYGALKGIYNGVTDEDVSPYLRPVNAVWNVIPGIYQGCFDGLKYGYNLRYNKGRSVEGHIFDLIEFSAKQAEKSCLSP